MQLTPRLMKIASLVPKGSTLADIGTDHAYIPVYCVKNSICNRAIAMDVNDGPLKNARERVVVNGVSDRVELRLSDGLKELKNGEADTIVIAGMGGLLIQSILDSRRDVLTEGTQLILQPMLAQKELREYLYTHDMCVKNEYLAMEGDKIYNVIVAVVGYKCGYSKRDIVVGSNSHINSKEIFELYKEKEIAVRRKILEGLKKASHIDEEAIARITEELEIFEMEGV